MFLLLTLPIRSSSIFFVFFFPLHSPFFFSTACLNPLNSLILSFPPTYKTSLSPPQTFAFLFLSLSHKRYYSFSNLCLCIVFLSLSLSLFDCTDTETSLPPALGSPATPTGCSLFIPKHVFLCLRSTPVLKLWSMNTVLHCCPETEF